MWWIPVALAADPVQIEWKQERAWLQLQAPTGQHISMDSGASADLTIGDEPFQISSFSLIATGLPLPDVRGREIHGTVSAAFCENSGTACHPVRFSVSGTIPNTKKGKLALTLGKPNTTEFSTAAYRVDATQVYEAALAKAKTTDQVVLLDFTAIWCPPCNQMAVEVLDASEAEAELKSFIIAKLDVDDPSSWAIKDRYHVGGYPTLIAVDGSGNEIGRQLGYPGRSSMYSWLAEVKRPMPRPSDPWVATPEQAAVEAWRIVREGQGDPQPWMARAAETKELHLARVCSSPNLDDAHWLLANAPETWALWAWEAISIAESEPGRVLYIEQLTQASADETLPQAAERLTLLTAIVPESEQKSMAAAAAAMMGASQTGDAAVDRSSWSTLLDLYETAGDDSSAHRVLERATKAYPEDPTFWLSGARLWLDQQPMQALEWAQEGLKFAWGDNKLRLAKIAALAMKKLSRDEEAKQLVQQTLQEVPEPSEKLEVRSHRYRKELLEVIK